jgi:pimeloyl-ACP methyl ester carboxylesterase
MKSLPALSPAVLAAVLAAVLVLAGPPAAVHAQTTAPAALDGTWHGTLDTGGQQLTVVFHLKRKGEGDALTATMDVPQQSVSGVSVSDVRATGDSLRLEVAQIGGVFKGTRTTDGPIDGTWRQSGASFPLVLRKGAPETSEAETSEADAPDRPQTPEPPFPYEREDATFRNADAGVTLAGTLTTPEGEGPHPAVVLVSGSGPQNRNGVVAGHETLHVLADALTRRGIAVLRYDERGVGESTGSFSGATTEDFAGDVRAALDWLRQREGLGKIGVVGWSEGALVAPMLAARSSALPDFLVLMGAPGVPGKQILLKQRALIAEAQGAPPASLDSIRAAQERLLSAAAQAPDSAAAAAQVRRLLRARQTDAQTIDKQIQQYTDPWFRQFMRHDPRPALRQTDAPVLALYGEHDLQVPPAQNADPLRKALSGNPDATVEVLPGLNHLFQPADTGLPSEYGQIEATIAPKALDAIAGWIAERTRAGGE